MASSNLSEESDLELNAIPSSCRHSSHIELRGPNVIFYKYVLTVLPTIGLLLHAMFWSRLATSFVPTLALYRRLLLVASVADAVKLVTYLLEAVWSVASNLNYLLVENRSMAAALRLLYATRTFSIFELVLVIAWVTVNCNHDVHSYNSGVTGDLARKLKDHRFLKSLAVITTIALSVTILTELPQQTVKGPYCFYFPGGDFKLLLLLQATNTSFRKVADAIKTYILPMAFEVFLCAECSLIWAKAFRKIFRRNEQASYDHIQGNNAERRPSRCQVGIVEDSQNEVRITILFILTPLCVIYVLCWSPHVIINVINAITSRQDPPGWSVSNEIVIWLKTVVELLPSALNPLIFTVAVAMYLQANSPAPNHQRASRETQESNV